MSKTASANLKTHLASATTTLATLYHITRADTTEYFYTDADEDITYSGDTYAAAASPLRSSISSDANLSVNNSELAGALLDSPDITEEDLAAGLFDGAAIEIMLINRESVADGVMILPGASLGEVQIKNGEYSVEVRGLGQYLQQPVGGIALKRCDASLGDARCQVTLTGYTVSGAVTGVTNHQSFEVDTAPAASGGLLTWTGGDNSGLSMEVRNLSGSDIVLFLPMPYDVQVGDTYDVYRGCDKNLSTCRDVFANVVNFRGFPSIVGQDELAKVE